MKRVGRTWSSNGAGWLWERLWYQDDDRFATKLMSPGAFSPPKEYPSEATFWASFEDEAGRFHGERTS